MKRRFLIILLSLLAVFSLIWTRYTWQCWLWPSSLTTAYDQSSDSTPVAGGVQVLSSDYVAEDGSAVAATADPNNAEPAVIAAESSLSSFSPRLYLCSANASSSYRAIFWCGIVSGAMLLLLLVIKLIIIAIKKGRQG